MAESESTSQTAKVTKSIKELKELLAELATDEEAEPAEEPSAPGVDPTTEAMNRSVRRADDAFKATIKWMVGAVSAMALIVFGSGPFLIDGRTFSMDDWPVIAGLAMVAVGASTVVFAASRVYEPEDASLGELHLSLQKIEAGTPMFPGKKRSLAELAEILSGPDASAHLGPGCDTVEELIRKIGALQERRLPLAASADGAELRRAAAQTKVDALQDQVEQIETRIIELLESSAKGGGNGSPPAAGAPGSAGSNADETSVATVSATAVAAADAMLDDLLERRIALRSELEIGHQDLGVQVAAKCDADVALAAVDGELSVYMLHRTVVISEAWVAEKRGVFRGARWFLVAGALLTLVGGTLYLTDVTGDDDDDESSSGAARTLVVPATVTIDPDAAIAGSLPERCLDRQLAARFGSLEVPTPGEETTVTIVEPGCEGELVISGDDTKPEGRGALVEIVVPATASQREGNDRFGGRGG